MDTGGVTPATAVSPAKPRVRSKRMDRTERFYKIDHLIRERGIVPVQDFLRELEVSLATFKRDIEYMRSRHYAPITWDREQDGYRFHDPEPGTPKYELPGLWFSPQEAQALLIAQHVLEGLKPNLVGADVKPLKAWHPVSSSSQTARPAGTFVTGIDGCRAGWLCLTQCLESKEITARVIATINQLVNFDPYPRVVAIDIPIGLMDAGPRDCDIDARARLGAPRCSSVFRAAIRPMLRATSREEASTIGKKKDGKGLSCQSWAIVPKIVEVDSFLQSNPSHQLSVREIHPEVSFWAWNGRRAMVHSKKTEAGRTERQMLVSAKYGGALKDAAKSLSRDLYAPDDLLDAFAALWTAERLATGNGLCLPETRRLDSCGLPMEIAV